MGTGKDARCGGLVCLALDACRLGEICHHWCGLGAARFSLDLVDVGETDGWGRSSTRRSCHPRAMAARLSWATGFPSTGVLYRFDFSTPTWLEERTYTSVLTSHQNGTMQRPRQRPAVDTNLGQRRRVLGLSHCTPLSDSRMSRLNICLLPPSSLQAHLPSY